jgi:hypothetical protein
VCFELGRFPHELPPDLPDEQFLLMAAYVSLRADIERRGAAGARSARGRAAEAAYQAAEAEAWAARRGGG